MSSAGASISWTIRAAETSKMASFFAFFRWKTRKRPAPPVRSCANGSGSFTSVRGPASGGGAIAGTAPGGPSGAAGVATGSAAPLHVVAHLVALRVDPSGVAGHAGETVLHGPVGTLRVADDRRRRLVDAFSPGIDEGVPLQAVG